MLRFASCCGQECPRSAKTYGALRSVVVAERFKLLCRRVFIGLKRCVSRATIQCLNRPQSFSIDMNIPISRSSDRPAMRKISASLD